MELKDIWNGDALGLEGEVVTTDCYRLKEINFVPDIFFDIGCNIGIATKYARRLFPDCYIVSLEPHPDNIRIFKDYALQDTNVLIEKAIGVGQLWHSKGASNGGGENYISDSVGYPKVEMEEDDRMEVSNIETIMLDELINTFLIDGIKSILKLDIEAGENCIFNHQPSLDALKKIDYICCELHGFGLNGGTWQVVQDITKEVLQSFEETHECVKEGVHFYATKR